MNSPHGDRALPRPGCPIRRSPDQHLLSGSPELIAASHVLRRLLAPRHSPCALSSLTMLATGRPPERVFGRNAWVSYHALALELTVTRPDCQRTLRGSASSPAPDRHRDPRSGSAGTAAGITRRRAYGADGDRTHDLRLAKPALSQLSYSPEVGVADDRRAGPARLVRSASRLPSHVRCRYRAGRMGLTWIRPPLIWSNREGFLYTCHR